jgi:hypothetical protein
MVEAILKSVRWLRRSRADLYLVYALMISIVGFVTCMCIKQG